MWILKIPFPGLNELFVQHIFSLLDVGKIIELRDGVGQPVRGDPADVVAETRPGGAQKRGEQWRHVHGEQSEYPLADAQGHKPPEHFTG